MTPETLTQARAALDKADKAEAEAFTSLSHLFEEIRQTAHGLEGLPDKIWADPAPAMQQVEAEIRSRGWAEVCGLLKNKPEHFGRLRGHGRGFFHQPNYSQLMRARSEAATYALMHQVHALARQRVMADYLNLLAKRRERLMAQAQYLTEVDTLLARLDLVPAP